MSLTASAAYSLAASLREMEPDASLPRDLPGRYGRIIRDLERLLDSADALSVVAGGWAVWHHGYAGRVTEDVDIVLGHSKLEVVKELASLYGFEFLVPPEGRWPKLLHRTTAINVDILPEFGVPGTPSRPAPVAIGNPQRYQAVSGTLRYITLEGLIELKLGAGRAKDVADIIELVKQHPARLTAITEHLAKLHPQYPARFEQLIIQAQDEA